MSEIRIEQNAPDQRLAELGVRDWPVWSKEVSVFPWHYDSTETCYVLEGDVIVTPDGGDPVRLGKGDLAVFPEGLSCTWDVRAPVRKHYRFG